MQIVFYDYIYLQSHLPSAYQCILLKPTQLYSMFTAHSRCRIEIHELDPTIIPGAAIISSFDIRTGVHRELLGVIDPLSRVFPSSGWEAEYHRHTYAMDEDGR